MTGRDKLLAFAAAVVGAIAAVDPIGLPPWAQGLAAVLAVGFAAIEIPAAPRRPRRRSARRQPNG